MRVNNSNTTAATAGQVNRGHRSSAAGRSFTARSTNATFRGSRRSMLTRIGHKFTKTAAGLRAGLSSSQRPPQGMSNSKTFQQAKSVGEAIRRALSGGSSQAQTASQTSRPTHYHHASYVHVGQSGSNGTYSYTQYSSTGVHPHQPSSGNVHGQPPRPYAPYQQPQAFQSPPSYGTQPANQPPAWPFRPPENMGPKSTFFPQPDFVKEFAQGPQKISNLNTTEGAKRLLDSISYDTGSASMSGSDLESVRRTNLKTAISTQAMLNVYGKVDNERVELIFAVEPEDLSEAVLQERFKIQSNSKLIIKQLATKNADGEIPLLEAMKERDEFKGVNLDRLVAKFQNSIAPLNTTEGARHFLEGVKFDQYKTTTGVDRELQRGGEIVKSVLDKVAYNVLGQKLTDEQLRRIAASDQEAPEGTPQAKLYKQKVLLLAEARRVLDQLSTENSAGEKPLEKAVKDKFGEEGLKANLVMQVVKRNLVKQLTQSASIIPSKEDVGSR